MAEIKDPENTIIMTLKDGEVVIELLPAVAPKHAERMKQLARDKAYDGVAFHRVIEGFMAQTGDPTGTGGGGPGYQFDNEVSDLVFDREGVVAMANAGRDTNGSQFFITVAPTTWLYGKHTIFGEVVDEVSRKVVDKIAAVATGAQDRPLDDVVIESITIEKA